MYRGPRPHRGSYPPAAARGFAPRGPPPANSFPSAPYRGEHARDSNGHPHGYRRHPEHPRRRYSSPGRGSAEDFRSDGPPPRDYGHRYAPSPPHGGLPTDHSLVITVGNELTGLSQSTGAEVPYARDYSPRRSSYEGHDEHSSRRHSHSSCRNRGWSRSLDRIHSRSRPRSRSRSRAVSRSGALSRGRSRPRSKSRSRTRSRGRSRARSRARSKSRPHSRSRSRGRSRGRSLSRGRSRSRGKSRGRSRGKSRGRSRSRSGSSSSSCSSSRNSERDKEEFRELEKARRRKELEDMLTMPTKSILKKRVDSSETDSPMIGQSTDSPQGNSGSGLSKDAEQLLCAVTKNINPDLLASVLAQNSNASALEELISNLQPAKESARGFLLPHESSSQENSDLTQLLSVMAEAVGQPPDKKKSFVDIEDEEKFLYGDEDEEDKFPPKEMPRSGQCSLLDVYGKTGPDVLYHEPKTGVVHDLHRKEYGHSYSHEHPEEESQITKQGKYQDKQYASASPGQHLDEEPQSNLPVTGSHDAQVRAEVEEYEKIQDLLKTIGLDLGVAEISKMAARTQERLQGKNPGKSSVNRHQSDRRCRSHSRSSSSNSRSRSSSRGSSCSRRSSHSRSSSYEHTSSSGRKKSVPLERHSSRSDNQSQREVRPGTKAEENLWTTTGPPPPEVVNPGTNNYPAHSAHQMPPYPQPHTRGVMPPNYPPPGYDLYGNYMPYMHQGWPMYPPPSMPMPPQTPMDDYSSPAIERPFLKVINTGANEAQGIDTKLLKVDPLQSMIVACSGNQRRVIEENNNAKQKQKVTEELEKLKKDRDSRMKKKDSLIRELETLRKQQGELLRKKRREKDGHKDPILMELGRLQEDVMAQISSLRTEHEAAEKKYEELVKVATILGLDHKNLRSSGEHERAPSHSKTKDPRSPEKSRTASITSTTQGTKSSATGPSTRSDSLAEIFEYYDPGNHWCKNCNITSGSMFDFFTHLHSKMHRKTLDPYIRPWASNTESEKKRPAGEVISKPAKGSEFLLPVRGFFCQLCKEFFGDPICAEAHVICHAHNEKYKKQMYENPLYEQRRNLDRQAGMDSGKKQTDNKRKRDYDDSQDEQKNSKASKDQVKNPKCKNEEEDRAKYIKEEERKIKYMKEEENKPKYKKEEVDRTKCRKAEEERTRYAKEEGERNKVRKEEEERYRQKKGDEERYKAEEDKYRYKEENRYKYREDNEKYRYRKEDEKSRYRKEDDKKYKYGNEGEENRKPRCMEEEGLKLPKSKWEEEEEEEEKPKYGKKEDKKQHQKGNRKDEREKSSLKDSKIDPEKPNELPRVLCGPSPAMLAKLRKKNEEATSRPAFGKFTWKKPEKTALEKEAEKIAAQFIKEDEESVAAATKDSEDQDAFAKSVAAAKSIAIKLSGKTSIAPSQEWVAYNQNKIRPNLPSPSNILRKSNVGLQNKPDSSDTPSLSVPTMDASSKSSETVIKTQAENEDVLSTDLNSKAFDGEEVQLEIPGDKSSSLTSASVSVATTSTVTTPSATVQEVEAVEVKAPTECMITLESDVAAPGVPKEEHKLTVMVRPPPQLQTLSSYKPKTNLAAAKAKDLFDIFYGSSTMASCSGSSAGNKVGCKQDSKAESGSLVTNLDKESTKEQDPNTEHLIAVSSLKCEEPSEDRGVQAEPPTFDLEVGPLVDSKMEEHSGSMAMSTVGCKNEADSLDCLANSEIIENIDMMGTNDDNQNPLDSQEAMTLSFSPPPGSFTEQLNLDTFEFSFDSL